MNARTSSTPPAFSTCRGSIQPRRAVPTPNRIWRASHSARWQSLSMVIVTPAATARRAVDLECGSGVDCGSNHAIEVDVVAG